MAVVGAASVCVALAAVAAAAGVAAVKIGGWTTFAAGDCDTAGFMVEWVQ